jgi:two-component system OmpR family sensor kinase
MGTVRGRWTLRRRLVVVLIAMLAFVAGIMGVVSALALRGSLVGQLDSQLLAASHRAAGAPNRHGDSTPPPTLPVGRELASDGPAARELPPGLRVPGQGAGTINLFVRDGETRSGYIDQAGNFQRLTTAQVATLKALPADGKPRAAHFIALGDYRLVATTTTSGDVVVTGLSTAQATTTVRNYVAVEAGVAALGLTLALVAGMVLVRRELRPLERVAATANRVSELPLDRGEVALSERVAAADTHPDTEVGQVGAALNLLLGHVERALAARHESETQVRQFVADASHELRTPLAAIRGYAELVRHLPDDLPPDALRAMSRVESESHRMTGLVEDMLLLARLDAGRPLGCDEVDLGALAIDAVADAHAAGPDHVWQLDLLDGPDWPDDEEPDDEPDRDRSRGLRAVVLGDDHRLQQMLINLLSNARVHTPPGTTVRTTVRVDGDRVTLRVQDDGPGIPEPLRPLLFRRFTRGNAARSPGAGSTGLGLAIVDAVVGAHGGHIDVDATPGATAFTVSLPAAP